MAMFPPLSGGGTGSGAMAGSAAMADRASGVGDRGGISQGGGWNDEPVDDSGPRNATRDGSRSGIRGIPADNHGFTEQGRLYDPILKEPMTVSAETHGEFWEDDMDYTESLTMDSTGEKATSQPKTNDKECPGCPPEGKVTPMVRRCSRWSVVTISYQTRICGTFYNPETKQIQEFKYCGVSFDGWKPMLCQFWEAKARYDQFFREDGEKKAWWKGDSSALNQAKRHQAIASFNTPLKIIWFFMQPLSCNYFRTMFINFKDIITEWQP